MPIFSGGWSPLLNVTTNEYIAFAFFRRVGSRRDGTTRTATTPLLAHPPRNKLRVEFLVRRSYTGYVLHEKEGREWRSGASKFPKMVRWPVKLSWKIFQRDMVRRRSIVRA